MNKEYVPWNEKRNRVCIRCKTIYKDPTYFCYKCRGNVFLKELDLEDLSADHTFAEYSVGVDMERFPSKKETYLHQKHVNNTLHTSNDVTRSQEEEQR